MAFQRKKPAAIGAKAPFPGFIEPSLATSIEKVPSGARWLHEIKFDGYRVQVHLANEAVKVFTRRGHDWTNRFKKIADDAWHIAAGSAIIDGEVVVPGADGSTDFSVLQNELKGKSIKIVMVAFDLLYLNGFDLRKLPLIERKAHLKRLIEKTAIQFSDHFEVDGPELYAHACKVGLEGVVSKVRDVDHGFDKKSTADLCRRLAPLIRKTQPYTKRIAHKGIWVEPELLAEIEYRAKSAEGKVRHPFFKGLRDDL